MKNEFPDLVSYSRFVELMQSAIIPLLMFLQSTKLGESYRNIIY